MLYIKRITLFFMFFLSYTSYAEQIKTNLPHIYYVNFPVVTATGALTLSGQYRLPRLKTNAKIPAVVILHSSGGVDSTGSYYAEALNKIGIASLEIDMWSPRGNGGSTLDRPVTVQETIPDAFAALAYSLHSLK